MRHAGVSTESAESRRRLWFGLAAAPTAWAVQGALGWLIDTRVCHGAEAPATTALRAVLGSVGLIALLVALSGGVVAYRSWRRLESPRISLTQEEGDSRPRFMALGGILVSASFIVGILWATLPVLFIDACVATR
jgi:hypothetical protein